MTTHQPPDPTATDFAHTGFDTDPDCRWCNAIDAEEPPFDAGLAEPEIRARALDSAGQLLARVISPLSRSAAEASIDRIGAMWLRLAELAAAYIRDGSQPGGGGEDDRDRRR